MGEQSDEPARLMALASYDIIDTPPEREFDEVTNHAATLFKVPVALISLVDAERQWFKSRHGLDLIETPREGGFCDYVVTSRSFLEIPDAAVDPRFVGSPLVAAEGGIRFYAGAPLMTRTGTCLGALCIADRVPRPPLSQEQRDALIFLARITTERIEARAQARARRFLDTVLDNLPAMLFVKDCATGKYLLVNRASLQLLGRRADEVIGKTDSELFPDQSDAYRARDEEAVSFGSLQDYDIEFPREDGRVAHLRTKRLVIDGPNPGDRFFLGVSEDLTYLRHVERRVEQLEVSDPLTGLLNRASLLSHLDALTRAGKPFAMLSIDLDRFKAVNDQHGHMVGDQFLAEVGRRLADCVAPDCYVARVGGDEFVILLVDTHAEATARQLADAVSERLEQPYRLGSYSLRGGVSIGGVVAPRDGTTVDELRQNADLALYRAKEEGRGRIRFFNAEMDAALKRRRILEGDLTKAVESNAIALVYQPVVSTETGQITSFEALARWDHPVLGMIPPEDFIAIAEECGLIGQLGYHILSAACREAAGWRDEIRVAVNLSPLQFEQPDFVSQIENVLATSGLPGRRLQLEVTEGLVLRDVDRTFTILTELRARGVQILMDDFGIGYSSLSYFARFPFDKVKIDRSFIQQMDHSPAAVAIISAVVELGRALNMGVVGEGVENDAQVKMLTNLGCTHLQGFYFGRPAPADTFDGLLAVRPESAKRRTARR